MFLIIIIITVAISIFFCIVLASFIGFIHSDVKKNDDAKKKSSVVLIPSVIIWALLIALNTILIITFTYRNKEEIVDKPIRIPAEVIGKGLALTMQSFETNWDRNKLQHLENLSIHPLSMDYVIQNETKIYDIELIFDNDTPQEIKLYLDDLIGNYYLVVCDEDDFVYIIPLIYNKIITEQTADGVSSRISEISIEYSNTIIPFGKSRFGFNVTVPTDVDITSARFMHTVIPLK